MAKREGFQTAGAVAGFVAFVGTVALYFMVKTALEELVARNNAAHKVLNKEVADITVDFGPSNVFDAFIDTLWSPLGLLLVVAVIVIVWLVRKVNKLSNHS